MSATLVEITGLHKRFGDNHVLRGIDLQVATGEVLCIIGPSGSGKSTLLRCVNLLETPTEGSVCVDGVILTDPDCDIDKARRTTGMVFQQFNLFAHMSVIDNVSVALRKVLKAKREVAEATSMALLERVGLAEKARAYPAQLSGGQQQRVAIARALAMGPSVMLFDEATSALDPELVGDVLGVMRERDAWALRMGAWRVCVPPAPAPAPALRCHPETTPSAPRVCACACAYACAWVCACGCA